MKITVKQAELAGAGLIREEQIGRSLRGKIYKATIYYGNETIDVRVLYKRNGNAIILGPRELTEQSISEFSRMLTWLLPKLPHPDYRVVMTARLGIFIGAIITALNIATITKPSDFIAIGIDFILIGTLIVIHNIEGNRYVR